MQWHMKAHRPANQHQRNLWRKRRKKGGWRRRNGENNGIKGIKAAWRRGVASIRLAARQRNHERK